MQILLLLAADMYFIRIQEDTAKFFSD